MSARDERARRKAQPNPQPVPDFEPAVSPTEWKRHGIVAAVLCLLVLAAYANCFRSGFVFDNRPAILDDARIRTVTPENVSAIWGKGYWADNSDPSLYRPLTTFSYLFNYAVLGDGPNAAGFHWINLLLHALNAVLLYGLGLVLFRRRGPALALAAIWAVHPALTESVTNIVGRADLLSCCGVLAGLLCHVRAASTPGKRKLPWLAGLAASAALAIGSKESGVVLVALILVYDLAYRKQTLKWSLSSYGVVALPFLAFLYLRSEVLATLPLSAPPFVNNPLTGVGFIAGRLTAFQVIGRYMWLILWPARLSCDYSYNQIPLFQGNFNVWGDWATILALLVCCALAWLAVASYQRKAPGFFFVALFFTALAPVANIAMLVGTIMAERLLYLPAVGLIGCAVWAVDALIESRGEKWSVMPGGLIYVLALVCGLLIVRTYVRNADWSEDRTLFESAVKASPASFKTHLNLAVALARDKANLDRAIQEGEIALAILEPLPPDKDDDAFTYSNMGTIYRMKGNLVRQGGAADSVAMSRQWYEKSLQVLARGIAVDRERAGALQRRNEAVGRRFRFDTYGLYREEAQTYLRMNEPQKALEVLDYGMVARPDPQFFQFASEAYVALHDQTDAAIALMEGLVIKPQEQAFASELVQIYENEPSGCAIQKTGTGSTLNLDCPLVHGHLCAASRRISDLYLRRGEPSEARKVQFTAAQSFGCPVQ